MQASPELSAVLSEWDRAEEYAKIAEQITGKVAIPCIMELRYAGRRIADAFRALEQDGNNTRANELLVDAKFDCLRAQHDAIDVSVNYIASFINEVLLKSEPLALKGRYEEIASYIQKIESYQTRIAESRRDRDKRSEIYKELRIDLESARSDFSKFKVAMIGMTELSDNYFRENAVDPRTIIDDAARARRWEFTARLGLIVAALAAVAGSVVDYVYGLIK